MPTEHAPGQQLDSPAMPEGKPPGTPTDSGPTIDPVCAMTVDPATTKYRANHGGHDYFFCSQRCQDKFLAEPQKYLAPKGPGKVSR